jgi:hypothetical protein
VSDPDLGVPNSHRLSLSVIFIVSVVVTFFCVEEVEEEKEKGNSPVGEIFTCIDTGRVLRVLHNRYESIF